MLMRRSPILLPLLLAACAGNPSPNAQYAHLSPEQREQAVSINLQLALGYLQRGDVEGAKLKLDKALAQDPNSANVHMTYGLFHSRLGQAGEADSAFQQAVRRAPDDSNVLNNYGRFLCRQQRYDEAMPMLLKAAENPIYNTPEIPYTNLATCLIDQGRSAEAGPYLRRALQYNARLPAALLQLAQLSYDQGAAQAAYAYLRRYSEVTSHTPRSLWLGVRLARVLQEKDAEASYSLQLRNRFPDSEEAYLLDAPSAR